MLGAYGALVDIVNSVGTYAWPIHSPPHLSLHPINALMCSMQVSKGAVEEFKGNAYP